MKILAPLIMAVLIAPFSASMAWTDAVGPKQCEVGLFIDRADLCLFLSGEMSGENTPDQKKLNRLIIKECYSISREFKRLDRKYKEDGDVQAILKRYLDDRNRADAVDHMRWEDLAWAGAVSPKQCAAMLFADRADACLRPSGNPGEENAPEQRKGVDRIDKGCVALRFEFKSLDKQYKEDNEVQAILEPYRHRMTD